GGRRDWVAPAAADSGGPPPAPIWPGRRDSPRGEWELSVLAARLAGMTVIWMLTLVTGLLVGAVMGFLVARSREAVKAVDLAARASAADERARAAEQRAALVDGQLAERFQVVSAQALDASARRFLGMAEGRATAGEAQA